MNDSPSAEPGYVIWRAWRDGMLRQGREVAPERMSWETLPERDKQLDAEIERALAAPAGSAGPPPGTRLVLVTEDADTLFFVRDDRGNRLTFEWGEPDAHGWYAPTITAHYDDVLPAAPAAGPAIDAGPIR